MSGPCAFSALRCLSPDTLTVLDALGFTQCTPVQEATLPLFCGNKDVSVEACTGSGKTLAYVLPIIEKMRRMEDKLKRHQVRGRAGGPRGPVGKHQLCYEWHVSNLSARGGLNFRTVQGNACFVQLLCVCYQCMPFLPATSILMSADQEGDMRPLSDICISECLQVRIHTTHLSFSDQGTCPDSWCHRLCTAYITTRLPVAALQTSDQNTK